MEVETTAPVSPHMIKLYPYLFIIIVIVLFIFIVFDHADMIP